MSFKLNISSSKLISNVKYSQMVCSASQQLLYYLQHLSLHWHGSVESDILLHRPLQISQINKTSSQQSSHSEHESLHWQDTQGYIAGIDREKVKKLKTKYNFYEIMLFLYLHDIQLHTIPYCFLFCFHLRLFKVSLANRTKAYH